MTMANRVEVEKIGTFSGHRDCVYALEKGEAPHLFYTSGSDGLVVQWNLNKPDEGKLVARIPNTVYAICCIPEKNILVVGQNFEGIHLIDLTSNNEIASLKLTDKQVFDIQYFDGDLIIAVGGGDILVVDYDELTVKKKMDFSNEHARTMVVDQSSKMLYVGYSDGIIRKVNLTTYQKETELIGHTNSVFTVSITPDKKFLLSGSRDAHLKVWANKEQNTLLDDIVAHMYTINYIAFREDGAYFATCSKDKSIKIWDASTFRLIKVIDKARYAGHGTSVNKLLWVSDNELVSCSDDRTISVWNLNNLK